MGTSDPISRGFRQLKPSPTLHINETVNEYWRRGKQIFHMGFGESRFDVHPKLQDELKGNSHRKSYLQAKGLPELCRGVAEYYSKKLDVNFSSEQAIIGPGSKALIFGIQMALDADLLLPTPSWVSYEPQAKMLQRKVFHIPADAKKGYALDVEALDGQVKQSNNPNKLLVINSPNNPTGQMFSEELLQELADYCRENRILVMSDEIYFLVRHGAIEHRSIAKYYPEGTFVLGGLSKHLSLGGWRIGVALLPDTDFGKELMKALVVVASEIWSTVPAPIQYAAILAYSNDSDIEEYIRVCSRIHGIRSRFIRENLSELGILCTKPVGAFYITANFDRWATALQGRGINTSSQLAMHLLEEHSIAALSADAFGVSEGEFAIRLSTSYLDFELASDSKRLLDLYDSGVADTGFMSAGHHPDTHSAISAFSDFVESLKQPAS